MGCHSLFQRIFFTQGLNPYLLCWQVDSLSLSHQGSPISHSTTFNLSLTSEEWDGFPLTNNKSYKILQKTTFQKSRNIAKSKRLKLVMIRKMEVDPYPETLGISQPSKSTVGQPCPKRYAGPLRLPLLPHWPWQLYPVTFNRGGAPTSSMETLTSSSEIWM